MKKLKNLELLYDAKLYLNNGSLIVLYYSFIHTYINYGNIAWGSTNRTNFKKINSLQKHAIRIIHCKDRFAHARELFGESKILGRVCYGVSFLLIVMFTASGLSVFCIPLQVYCFLASSVIFQATVFESTFERLQLEQHCSFRGLVIRP